MDSIESSAGRTEQQPEGYLAFIPNVLPPKPDLAFDEQSIALQSAASNAIGRLAGMGDLLPNRDLFVGMYVRKEALLSSQIENIESTLDEVLRFEEGEAQGVDTQDVSKVVNYVKAVNLGFERLAGEKPTLHLLQDMHRILVPDNNHNPGEFRDIQNWIGSADSNVRTARFVPPPVGHMHVRLANLMYYINEHQGPSPLTRCAIAHAQFETIHPFEDGNGRIGRMLVALMLKDSKVLETPLLYLSLYLKDNRREYYDRLTLIRERGEWNSWIDFFMRGVRDAAEEAIATSKNIVALLEDARKSVADLPANTRRVLDLLFAHPIVDARAVQRHTQFRFETASDSLKRLQQAGWVEETTGKKRGKTYRFSRYLSILEKAGEHEPGMKTKLQRNT